MFMQNTFRAFRHRDYFIFWCGLFLGHSGTLVQATAQGWLIFQLTNSPFYLGLDGLCLGLPRVLFSAFGGAVVDCTDRKLLFIATQSAFLLMSLFLGVMNYLGTIQVWHILLVSALTGFSVSFEQPVRQSILHDLVPRAALPNAVALYQMVFNGSMLFGPAIGGMLIPLMWFCGVPNCGLLSRSGRSRVPNRLTMLAQHGSELPQDYLALLLAPANARTIEALRSCPGISGDRCGFLRSRQDHGSADRPESVAQANRLGLVFRSTH